MSWVFDDISRAVASGVSRRHVLKMIAGALAGAAFAPLRLARAQPCEPPCTSGTCCGGRCCDTVCCGTECCPGKNFVCNPGCERVPCEPPTPMLCTGPFGNEFCCPEGSTCCGSSSCCGEGTKCEVGATRESCCSISFETPCNGSCCSNFNEKCNGTECVPITAIELLSFTAKAHADGTVTVVWETATEVDNTGFNLYRARARGGPYVKINDMLIPAQGNAVAGARYSFVDRPGSGIFRYVLEDVDYYGVNTLHGPVKVRVRP